MLQAERLECRKVLAPLVSASNIAFELIPLTTTGTFFQAIAAADCDGDNDIDIVATIVEPGAANRKNSLAWYENDGNNGFAEHIVASNLSYTQELVCADFDADGRVDIAATEQDAGTIRLYRGSAFGFSYHATVSGIPNVVGLTASDFDRDGDVDLLSISHWSGAVRLHVNNGNASFTTSSITSAEYGRHIACTDIEGDGDTDIVIAEQYIADATRRSQDLRTTLILNTGSGTFTKQYLRGGEVSAVPSDIDRDGDVDIISRNVSGVFLNRAVGAGTFAATQISTDSLSGGLNSWAAELVIADMDGDSKYDIVTGALVNGIETTAIYRQQLDGTFVADYTALPPVALVADIDDDGVLDIVAGGLGGSLVLGLSTLNAPPRAISLASTTIAEGTVPYSALTTLFTADADLLDTFTYALVAGDGDTDNAAFFLDGNVVKSNQAFDFEAKNSYSVRIRSTDAGGLYVEKAFTISITNVNEAPTDLFLVSSIVAENRPIGTTVGSFLTIDSDTGDTFTYDLIAGPGSSDNPYFAIVGSSLQTLETFNFETRDTYSVRVRATDAHGLYVEKVIVVSVQDAPEPLVIERLVHAAPRAYKAGQQLTWQIECSQRVTVTGRPYLALRLGTKSASAAYVGGSGTTRLVFGYKVPNRINALSVTVGNTVSLARGSSIVMGNIRLPLQIPGGGVISPGVSIDTVAPKPSGRVTVPTAGMYHVGQSLDFRVRFNETVYVSGIPALTVRIGSTSRTASYIAGSGSPELVFRYVVALGDATPVNKGVAVGSTVFGGAISDAALNLASRKLRVPSTAQIRVDGGLSATLAEH